MIKKISALLLSSLILFSLVSCKKGEDFVLTSEITPERQAQVDEVLDTFMQSFEKGDAKTAHSLFAEGFEATEAELSEYFNRINSLVENPFVKFDSYYIKDFEPSETVIKIKKNKSDENYVQLTPGGEELYCALYVSEGEKISYMFAVILAYNGEKFDIFWINPGDFKYGGQDAPALYEKAKALDGEGKTIAAYIYSCMFGNTMHPAGFYRYGSNADMEEFGNRLYSDVSDKFKLPMSLENTSNSSVYEIGIASDSEHGIIPLVLYKTDVSIKDTAAIEAESQKVVDALEKLSPGIRDAFDFMRLNVTNDSLDDNTTTVNAKTVTLKLK